MKKIISIFSLFILSISQGLYAADGVVVCPEGGKSLIVSKDQETIEELSQAIADDACKDSPLFLENTHLNFVIEHSKARCDAIDLCYGQTDKKEVIQNEAKEILKDSIPKAALLSALVKEVKSNYGYNRALNRFEELNQESVCPDEKIEAKCEIDIRQLLSAASTRSFIDEDKLQTEPLANESIAVFISKNLLSRKGKVKHSKEELSRDCSKKISFNRICEKSHERIKAVEDCEKKKLKGCLDDEQNALASLLNENKQNRKLYLAIEKQLCSDTRIVPETVTRLTLGNNRINSFNRINTMGMSSTSGASRAPASEGGQSTSGGSGGETNYDDYDDDSGPSNENMNRNGSFQISDGNIVSPAKRSSDDAKSFEQSDGYTLSDQFSKSFNEIAQDNSTNSTIQNNSWNNDIANRFSSLDEEKKRKEEEEAKKKLEQDANQDKLSEADRKKKVEMDALVTQINNLKAKLDEMNANVDELKSKKSDDPIEKQKLEKEAQEREKNIADLKKQIAELEADKKKAQAENAAKVAETERVRAREDVRKVSSAPMATAFQNRENERNEAIKRERELAASSTYNPSSDNYASVKSTSPSGGSSVGGSSLVLKSAGVQATSDSGVVYMTMSEVQKYPYHLSDNASSAEIEKMILGNNGASIILGNSEQIIPISENGVVTLDEKGRVKYKRVKISLVKSEKERKQNIAREISSIADLKKEEQKKRDLIRYQEMKKAIQLKK